MKAWAGLWWDGHEFRCKLGSHDKVTCPIQMFFRIWPKCSTCSRKPNSTERFPTHLTTVTTRGPAINKAPELGPEGWLQANQIIHPAWANPKEELKEMVMMTDSDLENQGVTKVGSQLIILRNFETVWIKAGMT
ncbi:hypothetical protein VP01_2508g2 [Puccinia sorghi]|uniref:SAM domain-containing protein n=1 Tax=Puccinia sorghi TaxID=27349 RepID=A0A0L6V5Q8_9BASI|nr:hypothetical protein VP01_2508g2 [Puccinia sorghi]